MRWQIGRKSTNVEDRRGMGSGARVVGGGGIGVLLLALVASLLGIDPSIVLQGSLPSDQSYQTTPSQGAPEEERLAQFVSAVLLETEETWSDIFNELGGTYQKPKLVLFSGSVRSGCGNAQAAMGPFYCPLDQKVYIDLSFYRDLKQRHQAPGDFAQAYVIAHEVGHHVQNLLGISDQVQQMQQRVGNAQANQLSVRLELQADCFAGIWARRAHEERNILEEGDVEEALNAASSIGDDRLQREAQGYVVPESFTHGSSQQRVQWFTKGIQTGDLKACDTFSGNRI